MDPQDLLARFKTLGSALTRTQILSLSAAFLLVVGIVGGSAYWLGTPDYRLLFTEMDAESAAQVAEKLRDRKIEYRLADAGRSILVPDTQVDQLRIDLAAEGLPASGRIGFEIFDKTQFGATEFLEQVNYRRALEGELARTVSTIADVASARVHIAMARDSLFGVRQQPAKASVIVKLKQPNRPLAGATVTGITSLVAASVEGLRTEQVVVMDSFGRPLTRAGEAGDEPLGAEEIERRQRYEGDLAARVVSMLEPVVGRDRVRVNVTARLSTDTEERTEETWDPNSVVRSRAVTQEGAAAGGPGGLAGARANLPGTVPPGESQPAPPAAVEAAARVGGSLRSSETTNYEIGKVVTHTIRPRGDVARLSVAVIVDDERVAKTAADGRPSVSVKPRDPAQLQKIQGLVAAAVGLDASRGDQLTVENISFDEPAEEPLPQVTFFERYGDRLQDVGRLGVVLVLGALGILVFGRALLRRGGLSGSRTTVEVGAVPVPQLPRTIAELEGEIEAQLDAQVASKAGDRKMPVLTKRLNGMTQKEPESAARLVRTWLVEDRKS